MKKALVKILAVLPLIFTIIFMFSACGGKSGKSFSISYIASEGGSIAGNSSQTIKKGKSGTEVTAVADDGYFFIGWSDGKEGATRKEEKVQADISITANFEIKVFIIVNYSAGTGGNINGATAQSVEYGGDAEPVTAVADAGYVFAKWSDDNANAERHDTGVIEDLAFTAYFDRVTNGVSYSAGTEPGCRGSRRGRPELLI